MAKRKIEPNERSRCGVYAGTFDPITNGHLDLIVRALSVVDTLYVAVAGYSGKDTLFSLSERTELVRQAVTGLSVKAKSRIVVESFSGLLVQYVQKKKAQVIVRGLRAVSDYEYEAQMAHINRHLAQEIETIFLVTSENHSYISSSIVKNIASNGGDITRLVPGIVKKKLQPRLALKQPFR